MINYKHIADAVEYYSKLGYKEIETPWYVSAEAINITLPPTGAPVPLADGRVLVGSAEQGFIQLMLDNPDFKGRYQSTTPCFRGEKEDDFHKPYFMKIELFDNILPTENMLDDLIDQAYWFFKRKLPFVNIIPTYEGFDIIDTMWGIELGSYGIRAFMRNGKEFKWLYGTGCAEPRLSTVIRICE